MDKLRKAAQSPTPIDKRGASIWLTLAPPSRSWYVAAGIAVVFGIAMGSYFGHDLAVRRSEQVATDRAVHQREAAKLDAIEQEIKRVLSGIRMLKSTPNIKNGKTR